MRMSVVVVRWACRQSVHEGTRARVAKQQGRGSAELHIQRRVLASRCWNKTPHRVCTHSTWRSVPLPWEARPPNRIYGTRIVRRRALLDPSPKPYRDDGELLWQARLLNSGQKVPQATRVSVVLRWGARLQPIRKRSRTRVALQWRARPGQRRLVPASHRHSKTRLPIHGHATRTIVALWWATRPLPAYKTTQMRVATGWATRLQKVPPSDAGGRRAAVGSPSATYPYKVAYPRRSAVGGPSTEPHTQRRVPASYRHSETRLPIHGYATRATVALWWATRPLPV
jgi:hypothetical protein